jgi:hypothetical protein
MMKARLIKPDLSGPKEEAKPPANDQQMSDSIWSWVEEFRLAKDDKARLDLKRLKYPEET